jgi:hypothetical protein
MQQKLIVGQIIIHNDIRNLNALLASKGEELRIAWAGTDEVDPALFFPLFYHHGVLTSGESLKTITSPPP